jgi:hypothetical protein
MCLFCKKNIVILVLEKLFLDVHHSLQWSESLKTSFQMLKNVYCADYVLYLLEHINEDVWVKVSSALIRI